MMLLLALLATYASAMSEYIVNDDGSSVVFNTNSGFHNDGRLETYYKYDADGKPTAVGVKFGTDMDSIFPPVDCSQGPPPKSELNIAWPMFPQKSRCAAALHWDHVQFNYNPCGHPGGWTQEDEIEAFGKLEGGDEDAINTLIGTKSAWFQRHMDIHFSMMSKEDILKITCTYGSEPCRPSEEEAKKFSNTNYRAIPGMYYNSPIAWVPGMGAHTMDKNGQTYEEFMNQFSFIVGTYDGMTEIWEGMVTVTALETLMKERRRLDRDFDIPLPEIYQRTGYFPTTMTWTKDNFFGSDEESYTMEFQGFEFRSKEGETRSEADLCPVLTKDLGACGSVNKKTLQDQLILNTKCNKLMGCKVKSKKGVEKCIKDKKACKKLKEHDCHLATSCTPKIKKTKKKTSYKKCA